MVASFGAAVFLLSFAYAVVYSFCSNSHAAHLREGDLEAAEAVRDRLREVRELAHHGRLVFLPITTNNWQTQHPRKGGVQDGGSGEQLLQRR